MFRGKNDPSLTLNEVYSILEDQMYEVIYSESKNPCVAMKKILFVFSVLLLMSFSLGGCSNSSGSNLSPVAEYEGGTLFKAGPVNVLRLSGTHYQMGKMN
jgi:hypothetical protein